MIKYGGLNRNIDTNDILSLLDEWYTEYFMNMTSTFHMREYFVIKSQRNNPNNLTYMVALSGENLEEYFKVMDDVIQSLMRRVTWDIVSRKSVVDQDVLPGTFAKRPSYIQSSNRCSHLGLALNLLGISDMGLFLNTVLSYTATNTVMSEIYEQSNISAIIVDLFLTREIRFN